MRVTEIMEGIIIAAAIAGAAGTVVSAIFAWRFREEIKRAEKRLAAVKLRPQHYRRVESLVREAAEHEREMAGASH